MSGTTCLFKRSAGGEAGRASVTSPIQCERRMQLFVFVPAVVPSKPAQIGATGERREVASLIIILLSYELIGAIET